MYVCMYVCMYVKILKVKKSDACSGDFNFGRTVGKIRIIVIINTHNDQGRN